MWERSLLLTGILRLEVSGTICVSQHKNLDGIKVLPIHSPVVYHMGSPSSFGT